MAVTGAWIGPGKCCQTGRLGSGKSVAAGDWLGSGLGEAVERARGLAQGGLGEAVPVGKGEGLKTRGVRVTRGVGVVPRQAASKAQPKRAARHSRRLALRRNWIHLESIEESALLGGDNSIIAETEGVRDQVSEKRRPSFVFVLKRMETNKAARFKVSEIRIFSICGWWIGEGGYAIGKVLSNH